MTLWAGRVDMQLAPEVWEFLKADDAELLPYDVEGTLLWTPTGQAPQGSAIIIYVGSVSGG